MTASSSGYADATSQSDYARKEQARLKETRAKLTTVKAKLDSAVAHGRITLSDELIKAQQLADSHLARVERRLTRLTDAKEESWVDLRKGLESAWDDLAQAIKTIIVRV